MKMSLYISLFVISFSSSSSQTIGFSLISSFVHSKFGKTVFHLALNILNRSVLHLALHNSEVITPFRSFLQLKLQRPRPGLFPPNNVFCAPLYHRPHTFSLHLGGLIPSWGWDQKDKSMIFTHLFGNCLPDPVEGSRDTCIYSRCVEHALVESGQKMGISEFEERLLWRRDPLLRSV